MPSSVLIVTGFRKAKTPNFEPLKAAVYTVKRRFFDKNYIARPVFACPSTA